jgi:hypothetical protein
VGGTGLGSCPVVGSDISSFEPSRSASIVLVSWYFWLRGNAECSRHGISPVHRCQKPRGIFSRKRMPGQIKALDRFRQAC